MSHKTIMEIRYVLGQTIKILETSGNYDLVTIHIPPHTSGPPPHLHKSITEFMMVVKGELEFVLENQARILKTGDYVDIPVNTVHTFNNKSDLECEVISIHEPKGFSKFFRKFGIPAGESRAIERSLDSNIITEIIRTAADFDMEIKG